MGWFGNCEEYVVWWVWKRFTVELTAMDGLGGEILRMRVTGSRAGLEGIIERFF